MMLCSLPCYLLKTTVALSAVLVLVSSISLLDLEVGLIYLDFNFYTVTISICTYLVK